MDDTVSFKDSLKDSPDHYMLEIKRAVTSIVYINFTCCKQVKSFLLQMDQSIKYIVKVKTDFL